MYPGMAVLNMVNICSVKLTGKSSGKKKKEHFSATLLTCCSCVIMLTKIMRVAWQIKLQKFLWKITGTLYM